MFNDIQRHKAEQAKKEYEATVKRMEGVVREIMDLLKGKDITVEECKRVLNACQMSVDRSVMGRKMSDFI